MMILIEFKGNGYIYKGNNSDIEIFASIYNGTTLRGKNLLPEGANSFL